MNEKIKTEWVKALRSGEYQQGTKRLNYRHEAFCCLGVLTDLYIKSHPEAHWNYVEGVNHYVIDGSCGLNEEYQILPKEVMHWAGLTAKNPYIGYGDAYNSLSFFNDEIMSFKEIADAIEESSL